jgi:hypothetical protein
LRTSSTSSERSIWQRLASAPLLALLIVAPVGAAHAARSSDIEQAWLRLTQNLDPPDISVVRERTDEILQSAGRVGLTSLTPLALGLVSAARMHPGAAEALLAQAVRLDPGCATAWLFLAKARLSRGEIAGGAIALVRGAASLPAAGTLHDLASPTAMLSLVIVAVAAFGVWGVLAVRRALPRLWHDLAELARSWRLGPNGAVLAILVLALPAFAACDPVWLAVWVFALCWAYLPTGQQVIGCLGLLLLAATPTLVELGFRDVTHPPNPILQATAALEEHRYEPQLLDSLTAVSDVFDNDAEFNRLLGDCYRQFGLFDEATLVYREGLRLAPKNGPLALALGTVQYLQGAYDAALQSFQIARDSGADPVVTNFDLALTLGQTYHFHESEEAMAAAHNADASRLQSLTDKAAHQLILPVFGRHDAEALVARTDPLVLLNRGLARPPMLRARSFGHPLTIGALLALVVAIGHFLVRQRTTGFASACLKCGRPFCPRCRLSHESQSYCAQCVNIFLKKDTVAIEAQLGKRKQLARRQVWLRVERHVGDLVLPGLGLYYAGRPLLGSALAAVALAAITLGGVWLPVFVGPALMSAPVWLLEAILGIVWLGDAVTAQCLPVEAK